MRAQVAYLAAILLVLSLFSFGGHAATADAAVSAAPGQTTVYLPNVTKKLGGPDGWQTPFIVQNIGLGVASLTMDFYRFGDGSLAKTRTVTGLAPGASVFHDPNSDPDLEAGGQFSVVVTSSGAPIVAVVNEHQNVLNQSRQEALSYRGLTSGSTRVYLPYVANSVSGWLTTMVIQNLGASATNVVVSLRSLDNTKSATLTRAIGPGRSQFIDPRIETSLVPGVEYAASLAADQPVAAIVNAHNDAADVPQPRGFSYNGVPASSLIEAFMPYVALNTDGIGRNTRLIVENMGLANARPSLFFRAFGQSAAVRIDGVSDLAPGQATSFDVGQLPGLVGGDFAVHVTGGQFAVVGATLSAGTAMGYTNDSTTYAERLYAPNVTRTLGGSSGWTTPLILQGKGTAVTSATLSWYRFSDGALVYRQVVLGLGYSTSVRIDPRTLPFLADNSQYSVVIESPTGGIAAIVTELNLQGGDGAMIYEAFPPPSDAPFGQSSCSPGRAAAGTTFTCWLYGLPPGAMPVSVTITRSDGAPTTYSSNEPVAADGSVVLGLTALFQASRSMSATAGGQTATAGFIVFAANFSVAATTSTYGSIAILTKPGLACLAQPRLPSGAFGAPLGTVITDGSGRASWTYAATATASGTGFNIVRCTSGSETLELDAPFSVP